MSGVDEQVRAAILRSMEAAGRGDADASHEIYAEDAVLEFPQSGERFVGKQNFLAWRRIYPGEVEFVVRSIRGGGALWVRELSVRYDGGDWQYGVGILEFRNQLVVRETIYVTAGWEAPEWRARWRTTEIATG
jgi:ketosteroid isomerase-like protein